MEEEPSALVNQVYKINNIDEGVQTRESREEIWHSSCLIPKALTAGSKAMTAESQGADIDPMMASGGNS
jgi:hypothetical protein